MTEENPVLEGGRIHHRWKSKEEVPKSIWEGNRAYSPKLNDEQWLAKLNRSYYDYWVRDREARKEEKKRKVPGSALGDAPCAGLTCDRRVKIQRDDAGYHKPGSRLCDPCKDRIREAGQDSSGFIRYVESPNAEA